MDTTNLNLLIPDKPDVERDAIAKSFEQSGGTFHRLARFWDPPQFDPSTVRVYGPDAFCLVLQQKLALTLCSPNDDLLLRVQPQFLNRQLNSSSLGEISSATLPKFIKPVVPKQFRAALYDSSDILAAECRGFPPSTQVFVSEPVTFSAEARAFVLDGLVLDAAVYEGPSETTGARQFVEALARSITLPRTVVVDVGLLDGRSWSVIEFNASWGAGLNGCEADKVLPAIVAASCPTPVS